MHDHTDARYAGPDSITILPHFVFFLYLEYTCLFLRFIAFHVYVLASEIADVDIQTSVHFDS